MEPFPEFFARTFPSVSARALVLTRDRVEAEDAVRAGYREAWRRWDAVGAPEAFVYREPAAVTS